MTSESEMLMRLRSGMNAMFDAASADVVRADAPLCGEIRLGIVPASAEAMSALPPLKLDDSAPASGYSRSREPDFSFSEDEIAAMTGGSR